MLSLPITDTHIVNEVGLTYPPTFSYPENVFILRGKVPDIHTVVHLLQ